MSGKILRISNPERVQRILDRAVSTRLSIFFRAPEDPTVSIKGYVDDIMDVFDEKGAKNRGVRISGISERGMRFVRKVAAVQVEFVLMSTKVVFVGRVLKTDTSHIVVSLPKHLISVNRRKNERFSAIPTHRAFFRFNVYRPSLEHLASLPLYNHYSDLSGFLSVEDISLGGICVATTYPGLSEIITDKMIDQSSELHLAMGAPIKVPTEVLWIKRLKEHVKDEEGTSRHVSSFRVGIQFLSVDEQLKNSITQFIQQVVKQEAI